MNNVNGLLWKIDVGKSTLFEQVNKAMQRYEERTHLPAKYVAMRETPGEQLALLGVEVVLSDKVPAGYFIITGELE